MKPGSPSCAGDRAQHLCNDGDSVDSFSITSDSTRRPKLTKVQKWAIAAGAVLLVVGVAVAVGVSMSKPKSQQPGELLSESYCSHLPDSSRQHCHDYFVSQGGEKFTAAADWRHYNHASCECRAEQRCSILLTACAVLQDAWQCLRSLCLHNRL